MKASGAAASRGMRVLSPKIDPPERALDGSTARTATRFSCAMRWRPNASMKVLFPTPGTPLTPMRAAPPVAGRRSSSSRCASSSWSGRVDSTSVIAFASARRSPARTPLASASGPLGPDRGIRRRPGALADEGQHAPRGLRNGRPRSEDGLHPGALEEGVVARRDDAANRHDDVAGTELLELLHELRDERLVATRLGRDADDVDVVLDRLPRDLVGRLEERADVDVEAEIGKRRGDHLGAAVVTVLADLPDEEPRATAVLGGELRDFGAEGGPLRVVAVLPAIDAGDGANLRVVATPDLLERAGDLADGRARPGSLHGEREEVPLPRLGRVREGVERRPDLRGVAGLSDPIEPQDLRLADGGVVDLPHVDLRLLRELEPVHADNDVLAPVDPRLTARGRLLDLELRHAGFDRLRHAAHRLDLLDEPERLAGERVRQRLHEVRAAPRVDDLRDAGLELEDELGIARDPRRGVGRERDRLVEGVRVEALRTAEDGRHRLDRGANDVVVGVLL